MKKNKNKKRNFLPIAAILFGIVFLMLGIMGEYVGKLILTSNKTPQYVIRETLNVNSSEKEQKIEGKNDD